METPRRVTARDVAARAGVSPGTVSKALSGHGAVHADTRARVLAAARELGLAPRGARRAGAAPDGGHRTVALVAQHPFDRRTSPVLLGVLEVLSAHDVALQLCDARGDAVRERAVVQGLMGSGVDGLLVVGGPAGGFTRAPLQGPPPVPVLYVRTASTSPHDESVVPDDRGGAEAAARHLVATGRRAVVCLLGPATEQAAQVKAAAARDVLAVHGLRPAADPLHGTWDEAWGRQAVLQLVAAGVRFDGVLCGNDLLARGALAALQAAGLRVPDDVAVVGFDDWDVMVEAARPRLTSVDLRLAEVGRTAARRMLERLDGAVPSPGTSVVESRLVPRGSTAPATTTVPATTTTSAASTGAAGAAGAAGAVGHHPARRP